MAPTFADVYGEKYLLLTPRSRSKLVRRAKQGPEPDRPNIR
jgi:hypothetical protein